MCFRVSWDIPLVFALVFQDFPSSFLGLGHTVDLSRIDWILQLIPEQSVPVICLPLELGNAETFVSKV